MEITDATLEKLGVTATSNLNCVNDLDLNDLSLLVNKASEHGVYSDLHTCQVFLYIENLLGHRVMCITIWETSAVNLASDPILFDELVDTSISGFEQARDILNRVRTKIQEMQEEFAKHYAPIEK